MSTGKMIGLIHALGGSGGSGGTSCVQYTEQSLTEEQQMQARKNLGINGVQSLLDKFYIRKVNQYELIGEKAEESLSSDIDDAFEITKDSFSMGEKLLVYVNSQGSGTYQTTTFTGVGNATYEAEIGYMSETGTYFYAYFDDAPLTSYVSGGETKYTDYMTQITFIRSDDGKWTASIKLGTGGYHRYGLLGINVSAQVVATVEKDAIVGIKMFDLNSWAEKVVYVQDTVAGIIDKENFESVIDEVLPDEN